MRPRSEQTVKTLILRDLTYGPATVHELSAVTGIHIRNVRHYLSLLKDERKIHIAGWEQRTGPALPIYALHARNDVPRPQRKQR